MERLKGPFYLFAAFTLAGTSVISARFVVGQLGVFTITSVSLFFALLCLLPFCWSKLIKTVRIMSAKDWLTLAVQALCGIYLFRMFLLQGLLNTSTGEAGILTGATPAITAILAKVLLKEPVNRKNITGIISTVGGILLLQGFLLPGNKFSLDHLGGNILVLCAATSESLFNIFSRLAAVKSVYCCKQPINPMVQTTIVSAIALFLCLISALFEHPVSSLLAIGFIEWLALGWYGTFVTALAFIFWYAGIKRCNAYTAAAFSGMMPFTAVLLSVMVLGEHIEWQQWSGGMLVILGMILIAGNKTSVLKTGCNGGE